MTAEVNELAEQITANVINCVKKILTADEAAKYLGISKSTLYKMTMAHTIPHYKPMGKMMYFEREELERWILEKKVASVSEVEQRAQGYCMKKGGVL